MTLNRKSILAVLALLAGLGVLYVINDQTVHAPPSALANFVRESPRDVQNVSFVDAAGKTHLLVEYRGRFVLLNLWGTWCAPCVRELPALARLSSQMPPDRFAVVAVALPPGDVAIARGFLVEHGAGRLTANFDSTTSFLRSFHAYGLPVTILIDPKGREIGRAIGADDWSSRQVIAYLKSTAGIQRTN